MFKIFIFKTNARNPLLKSNILFYAYNNNTPIHTTLNYQVTYLVTSDNNLPTSTKIISTYSNQVTHAF